MSVLDSLVGQASAISAVKSALSAATTGLETQEMTHAWLFTGPPGSGRSNLAQAFAAALVCPVGGCDECDSCRLARQGSHPDIEQLDVAGLSIKIDEVRELISRTSFAPAISNWRVIIVEDCDRMTEAASNALLKALEEPGARTVWLLCAPTSHDVLPTIRSRCRLIALKTPTVDEIARFLTQTLGAEKEDAWLAAKISQGHIGKAKAFLKDEDFRRSRTKSFEIFQSSTSESKAIRAARELLDLAEDRANSRLTSIQEREEEELRSALSNGSRGLVSGGSKALKDLEREQKARLTRAIRDEIDGALVDYASLLRDCLAEEDQIVNQDARLVIRALRLESDPEAVANLAVALGEIRESLTTNASQILLLENFFLKVAALRSGKKHLSA